MNIKKISLALSCLFFGYNSLYSKDWADKKDKMPSFFVGVNVGTFFANNNTAALYDGSEKFTPYGVNYILTRPANYSVFLNYFNQNYTLEELPQNPSYSIALDLGLHAGFHLGSISSIFVDINLSNLAVKDVFTVLIDDPNNRAIEPIYEQIPIYGEEKRININLGNQLNFFNKNNTTLYWSLFGNFNTIQLERNYFVIDNKEYEIAHITALQPDVKPNGIGYGVGTGLGFKYQLAPQVKTDLTYNFYYIKTRINDNLNEFGSNNGIKLRIIWEY